MITYEISCGVIQFYVNLGGGDWHPSISIPEGYVMCDCPDFYYRKGAGRDVRMCDIKHQCKHIKKAMSLMVAELGVTPEVLMRARLNDFNTRQSRHW